MKKILPILFFTLSYGMFAQNTHTLQQLSFHELEVAQQKDPRPYVIFLHTDWCRFCHGMKKNTFTAPNVIKVLNERFYFISMNAEQKEAISFLGHTFNYRPSGVATGIHELAEALGTVNKKIAYPSIIFLNAKNEIILQHVGFADHKDLLQILEKIPSPI